MKNSVIKENVINGTIRMVKDQSGQEITREQVKEYLKRENVDLVEELRFIRNSGY